MINQVILPELVNQWFYVNFNLKNNELRLCVYVVYNIIRLTYTYENNNFFFKFKIMPQIYYSIVSNNLLLLYGTR